VLKKSRSEGGLGATDGFPVGGAEVGVKRKAYLEEQLVGKDVQKGARHIKVMFYLTKARLDVIGMDDNVVVRV
jgi:hypothetical protein